jgi:hypothetical protein
MSERFQKNNIKIVERGNIDTPNTQIHDHSPSCTGISIKGAGVNPVIWAQTSPLSDMMGSWKCFPRVD